MLTRTRSLLAVSIIAAVVLIVWLLLALHCPSVGIALTANARNLHRLKNRTVFPGESDFDFRITLEAMLEPGDDRNRWSTERAGRIQGEVIDVAYARPEATNCFNPCRRDIHILVASRKAASKLEQVVVEVTPNLRDWVAQQGMDWSEQALQSQLVGHWVEFEGWLYCDVGHAEESENIAPHAANNWRATAWEIHPVTKIRVIS